MRALVVRISRAEATKIVASWPPKRMRSTLIGHGLAHSGRARKTRASGPSLSKCAQLPEYAHRIYVNAFGAFSSEAEEGARKFLRRRPRCEIVLLHGLRALSALFFVAISPDAKKTSASASASLSGNGLGRKRMVKPADYSPQRLFPSRVAAKSWASMSFSELRVEAPLWVLNLPPAGLPSPRSPNHHLAFRRRPASSKVYVAAPKPVPGSPPESLRFDRATAYPSTRWQSAPRNAKYHVRSPSQTSLSTHYGTSAYDPVGANWSSRPGSPKLLRPASASSLLSSTRFGSTSDLHSRSPSSLQLGGSIASSSVTRLRKKPAGAASLDRFRPPPRFAPNPRAFAQAGYISHR